MPSTSSKVNRHSFHCLLILLHFFHPQRCLEESIKVACCFFFCVVFVVALLLIDCCICGCFSCNFTVLSLFLLLCPLHLPLWMEESIKVCCCFFYLCCLCFSFVSFDCCIFGCFSCIFPLFSLFLLQLFHPHCGWRNQ